MILDAVEDASRLYTYCATETDEDVMVVSSSADDTALIYEQDKNQPSVPRMSFAHSEVQKSMVSFLDSWMKSRRSPKVVFCFYSTSGVAKENLPDEFMADGLSLPPAAPCVAGRDRTAVMGVSRCGCFGAL